MNDKDGELTITVGIGEMKISRTPAVLTAVGLGSCVAVIIRDRQGGWGGMAHIMLPWQPRRVRIGTNLFKYADYAIERMVEEVLRQGGSREHLEAKLVGGAHMFGSGRNDSPLDIGQRNVEAVRRKLRQLDIPIRAEEVGGNQGRSVETSLKSGQVRVRTVWKDVREI